MTVNITGSESFTNSGTIAAALQRAVVVTLNGTDQAPSSIVNSGLISGQVVGFRLVDNQMGGTVAFSNSGLVIGRNDIGMCVVHSGSGSLSLSSSGTVSGTNRGVKLASSGSGGTLAFSNTGTISTSSLSGKTLCLTDTSTGRSLSFSNSGRITGHRTLEATVSGSDGTVSFVNSGCMLNDRGCTDEAVKLSISGPKQVTFINSGTIAGLICCARGFLASGSGSLTFENSRSISSVTNFAVEMALSGDVSITNSGVIDAPTAIRLGGSGSYSLGNTGTIKGLSYGGSNFLAISNCGTIASGVGFSNWSGNAVVDNRGSVVAAEGGFTFVNGTGTVNFSNVGTIVASSEPAVGVASLQGSFSYFNGGAITGLSGLSAVCVTGTVSVANTGTIAGGGSGIALVNFASATVCNDGSISVGGGPGLLIGAGSATVTNRGIILGALCEGVRVGSGGSVMMINHGLVRSTCCEAVKILSGGTLTLENYGTLTAGTLCAPSCYAFRVTSCATGSLTMHTNAIANGRIVAEEPACATVVFDGAGTFNDDVVNFTQLYKVGCGEWTLGGSLSTTALAVVDAGTLTIDNSLTSPAITVNSGATLAGTGELVGTVTNGGTISPGHSPGTLNITGNYTQSSSGTYLAQIASSTQFDRLLISGTAQLGGTLHLDFNLTGPLPGGSKLKILVAGGGITTGFDQIVATLSASVMYTVVQLADAIEVNITGGRTAFASRAQTQPQAAVAGAVDANMEFVSGQDPGDPQTFAHLVSALDAQTTDGALGNALDQLSPLTYQMHRELMLLNAQMYANQLDRYFDQLRLNLNGESGSASAGPLPGSSDIARGAPLPVPTGLSQFYSPDAKMGAFAYAYGFQAEDASQLAAGGVLRNGFDLQATGGMMGVDRRINDHLAAGLAIGGGSLRGDLERGRGQTRANDFQIGPYASYKRDRFYLDSSLTYTRFDFDSRRVVAFPGFVETEGAHHRGHSWSAYSSFGYLWRRSDGFLFGPIASLQATRVTMDAFTEIGGPAALSLARSEDDSLRGTLGIRATKEYRTDGGTVLRPEFRLRWAHEFEQPGSITASFAASNGTPFTTNLVGASRDSAIVGTSVTALLKKDLALYGTYDNDFGRPGTSSNAWRGGLALKF